MSTLPLNDDEPIDDEQKEAQTDQGVSDGGDQSILPIYLNGISNFNLLNAQEELYLGEKISQYKRKREIIEDALNDGSMDQNEYEKREKHLCDEIHPFKERMINSNLRLVVSIAKRYQHRGLSLPDLINEGNIGLIEAVERFDYRRGCRFSTYGTWWIRQALIKAIADKSRAIRVPIHMLNKMKKCEFVTRTLLQQYGREPSRKEIADYLKIPEEKVLEYEKVGQETSSLDSVIDDEQLTHLGDMICSEDDELLERGLYRESLRESISRALSYLSDREQRIIRLRYGLDDDRPPLTLEATGRVVGITRERVRQLQEQSIEKLRRFNVIQELRDYI